MDFTLKTYKHLLTALQSQGFSFLPFCENINQVKIKTVVLRQDVDLLPQKSLEFAKIQAEIGIRSSFYFRAVPESFDESVIKEIHGLGHEVGYHYEDISLTAKKRRAQGAGRSDGKTARRRDEETERRKDEEELISIAIESFQKNLEKMRKIAPVKTICMHGSPMSRWDSRLLWKYYDYHDFGIVGEPYFDLDFDEVFYLTDTGRRWDGEKFSVRDKGVVSSEKGIVNSDGGDGSGFKAYADWKVRPVKGSLMDMTQEGLEFQRRYQFRSTTDIFKAVENGYFPTRAMITMHPQRWTDKPVPWMKELIWQNTKNVVKYFLIKGIVNRE